MDLPNLLIVASGEAEPGKGGSGFKKLVEGVFTGILLARIVGVVSNHARGGVYTKVGECKDEYEIEVPFIHSPKGRSADDYRRIIADTRADFVALSGWLGFVEGHDPRKTFNIHPALDLKRFGGKGFHGHLVHEAVVREYRRPEGDPLRVTHSGVTMHFATEKYDDPAGIFFQRSIKVRPQDTATTLGKRVNLLEHAWQAIITNRVVHGQISWDGKNPESIVGADIQA